MPITTLLFVASVAHVFSVLALLAGRFEAHLDRRQTLTAIWVGAIAGDVLDDAVFNHTVRITWVTPVVGGLIMTYALIRQRELYWSGAATWASLLLFGASGGAWGLRYLAGLRLSATTAVLLWTVLPFALITLPSSVVTQREGLEPLIRRRWRRQHRPQPVTTGPHSPFVSIQVPCHDEPPDIVIGTLNELAKLDYPAFEVLVIDNNTVDPDLWLPVRDHCDRLGPRFRFLHVEGITGAKAGALNWARPHIDPRAELIGVVDADYHVHPEWLARTVGFLDDARCGFVQPPHAYRRWHTGRFTRMANWEYGVFFRTGMVSLQEHGAGITVGTMSVIRLTALDAAGGWAEWCQTEDSELAIRVHDAGYDSVYLTEPLGWGLIPDTFTGYRQQRHRWTYGPVQELRHHWRRFLPERWGGSTHLDWRQKVHHLNHGLDVVCIGIRFLTWPLSLLLAASLVVHHERIPVPFELFLASTVVLVTSLAIRWLQFRITGATLRQAIGAAIAYQALSLCIPLAAVTALTGRTMAWRRTNKFRTSRRGLGAVRAARAEIATAAAFAAAGAALLLVGSTGVTTMLAIGFGARAAAFCTAPLVAVIADHDLQRHAGHAPVDAPWPPPIAGHRYADLH